MIPETATAALALNPFEKFAQTTKRDERDPYVMFNFDRMINFAARVSDKNRKKTFWFLVNFGKRPLRSARQCLI